MPLVQLAFARFVVGALFQRRFVSGEVLRYAVVSDWESERGNAHYEYEMLATSERSKDKKTEWSVMLRLQNQRAVYDGHETRSGLFGAVPMRWTTSGPPQGLSAGGAANTYVLPLLAFTLPPVGFSGTEFSLPPVTIEQAGTYEGGGRLERLKGGLAGLTLEFRREDRRLKIKTEIRLGAGTLQKAEGEYQDSTGTLRFTIVRR